MNSFKKNCSYKKHITHQIFLNVNFQMVSLKRRIKSRPTMSYVVNAFELQSEKNAFLNIPIVTLILTLKIIADNLVY